MPWEVKTVNKQRRQFVKDVVTGEKSISQLCRDYGITRKTGYKWLNRFKDGENLSDLSRRPFCTPNKTPEHIEKIILNERDIHPFWGGKKLRQSLLNKGYDDLPAISTISAILKRQNKITPEESIKHTAYQRFEKAQPNELWQADFKGDFRMLNGERCYPLTVLDDHSRYLLAIDAKSNMQEYTVFESFERLFKEYGLPQSLLTDNGPCWAHSLGGFAPLEIWLMKLNILPIHGRPYHPQTQGKEERLHRTMKLELLSNTAIENLIHAQDCFDIWRYGYNNERPHEALEMKVPAKVYHSSHIPFPTKVSEPEYESGANLRKVNCKGYISVNKHRYYLSESLANRYIQILFTHTENKVRLCYGNFQVGMIDQESKVLISRKIYPLKT